MTIGIIGAGNMGGAIARGIAAGGNIAVADITVTSPNRHGELDALKADFPDLCVATDNRQATGADVIIVAVKPWLLDEVMSEIADSIDFAQQILVSIVAGASLEHLATFSKSIATPAVFRVIPNTAIAVGESMTFMAADGASAGQVAAVSDIFSQMGKVMLVTDIFSNLGKVMVVEERLMGAGTAIASCGIAYVMRYVRAATEAGVELGMRADDAKKAMLQTLIGAARLLEATGSNPEAEIDKVTTPGGLTIKGLNAMERYGFTTAVIEGLKASMK